MRPENDAADCEVSGGGSHVVGLFTLLSDPVMLSLLEFVIEGDRSVAECSVHLGVSDAVAARYLNTLAASGWIKARSLEGRDLYGSPGAQAAELMSLAGSMAAERSSFLSSCACINGEAASSPPM